MSDDYMSGMAAVSITYLIAFCILRGFFVCVGLVTAFTNSVTLVAPLFILWGGDAFVNTKEWDGRLNLISAMLEATLCVFIVFRV
jgi:hypothetical protein